jgi:hypothetical protein
MSSSSSGSKNKPNKKPAWNQPATFSFFDPEDGGSNVTPKRMLNFTGLRDVIFQKKELLNVTLVYYLNSVVSPEWWQWLWWRLNICEWCIVFDWIVIILYTWTWFQSRSQWPCGLKNELSSPARTLGLCVRIPLEAWMSVCVYSVCVVLCVGSGLAMCWSPVQGVLQTVYRITKLKKAARVQQRGVKPQTDRQTDRQIDVV